MDNLKRDVLRKGLPWGRDVRWWVVAIEAACLVAIGTFMLVDKSRATDILLQLIGVVLLGASLLLAGTSLREAESTLGFFDPFRAGIGTACGAIATVSWWSDYIQDGAVRSILGWGLVAFGVLHIVGMVVVRGRGGLRLSVIAAVAITVLLGIVLLTSDSATGADRITFLGVTFLVFGALLAALAYYIFSRGQASTPAARAGI